MKKRKTIYSTRSKLLAKWLVDKRKEAGLSQRELAEKLGVVRSYVSRTEQGERRVDIIELVDYCKVLNADLHEFVEIIK